MLTPPDAEHNFDLLSCRTSGNIGTKKYLILIEPTETGFSSYAPDLPGCVSTGHTREEVEQNMREAVAFHLDGLREEGQSAPEPQTLESD